MYSLLSCLLTVAFLVNEDPTPTGLDFSGLITALTGAVTAQQIITYMAGIVAAGITIYVAYVFGRKAISAFTKAIRGKAPTM